MPRLSIKIYITLSLTESKSINPHSFYKFMQIELLAFKEVIFWLEQITSFEQPYSLGYMVYHQPLEGLWWICTWEMVGDRFIDWRWLTQWLFRLSWVLWCHSSLGHWPSLDNFGDVVHDGHIAMVAWLENALLGRSNILHLGWGHWVLNNKR